MSAHTLGPWVAIANRVYATAASGHNTMTTIEVAVATRADPRARAKVEQNARLIAASPTMAEYIERRANAGDEEARAILESIHASR